ncbi:MAG: hypothetical protein GTO55_04850 [Armatimonadetes bacterium]|nr:hypothetical protein [Armatimonadota bacterium]NIM23595.1 hypothetical protein [Armatimonadota bacterium]NIM67461.1 hypothetical protein [Armatimonadota bacterium]NIM75958.1 hypothetical protein [Armatimonadota bacterium]NIN05647.1 hypothetical protein [Armatimonadota bacterium]
MEHEPILLDLSGIAQQPGARGSFSYSLSLPPSEELICEGPVEVALEAHNSGRALLVRGTFAGKALISCARCLEEVPINVKGKIEEQFSLPGVSEPDLDLIDQSEPGESAFADEMLNVSELIRQQLLISLPLRVLCRPSCKGLCATCGQDLNLKKCDCPEGLGHPAWESLRDLVNKQKE